MEAPLIALSGRYWRMLHVHWQASPFASGSHLIGGRWNAPGIPALYLGQSYSTAILEAHQDIVRPGTLVGYDVEALAIADLTDAATLAAAQIDMAVLSNEWRLIYRMSAAYRQAGLSWND